MISSILLLLIIFVIGFVLVRKNSKAASFERDFERPDSSLPLTDAAYMEDEEFVAVIMAAVSQFEDSGELIVLSIKPSSNNWKLTGYQQAMRTFIQ